MNSNNASLVPATMIPDGTYRGAIGTLDVVAGRATLRASTWSDYEDGRHGTCPASVMSAAEVAQYTWWRDGIAFGDV